MSLGDDVLHALPDLRAAAWSLMRDTGTISRPGVDTFNPATGLIEPGVDTVIYDGVLRVRQPTAQESEVLFGEQQVTRLRLIVDVPHDTTGVLVDDVVTVSETADDDLLPPRQFRVTGILMGTFVVMKSYPVEVVE